MAEIIRSARERGISWSEIAAHFRLSKERIMQISGFKIPESLKRTVLVRANGVCEVCTMKSPHLYVTRLNTSEVPIEENVLASCKGCFYDQNSTDRAMGLRETVARRKKYADATLPDLIKELETAKTAQV